MEIDQLPELDLLRPDIIRKGLSHTMFKKNIVFHDNINSTNLLAKELGAGGATEGTLVITEKQTGGRGRRGRKWISPAYVNLLFSMLLRPSVKAEQVFGMTMIMAIAVVDAISETSGLNPLIKWPNDIYINKKKLGGILTEFSMSGKVVDYVVIGLGLNVNWKPVNDNSMLFPVTSVCSETGCQVSRENILVSILKRFDLYYRDVMIGNLDEYYKKWNERSMIIGEQVIIESPEKKIFGKAISIDRNGSLIILNNKGRYQSILCGDVSVREIKNDDGSVWKAF